ncbi:MAG: DUF5667 domain-containing protein [Chloroflexota bacterium]
MSEQRYDPEVLARRLDQALPAHKTFLPPVTPDPLVNLAAEVAKLSLPTLSSSASSRIEARMLAAFDEQYRPRIVERPRRRAPSVLSWALIASLALVVLLVGLTPAVAASLPGEPLYSVKQLYEKVELSTATTSAAKANVYLQQADRRAQEALTLLERNQFDPTLVTAALSNITAAGKSADDVRASARLRGKVLEVNSLVSFVLQNAQESGLTSPANIAPLNQQVRQNEHSDLLLPLPTAIPSLTATPTSTQMPTLAATSTSTPSATPSPTEEETETPSPEPDTAGGTPTCEYGQACLSQGMPGGQVIPPTPRPTNVHRNTPAPPPTSAGGGNANGGNGNGDNGGGNSNGGGDSAGGSSNGGGSSGGNGNGKGGG